MNKLFFSLICYLFISTYGFSQSVETNNVGINTTTPHASAALDVVSTTQGVLVPRMTASQRGLISSPATGLLVYQSDATAGFYFYNGTTWTQLGATGPQGIQGATGATGPQGIQGAIGPQGATGATGPQGIQGAVGPQGIQGATGANGTNGQGVPTGGTTGQVLSKIDGTNYNTQWITPAAGSSGWGLTGNAGTLPASNFLGTTDNQPLVFRTNNIERWRITPNGRLTNTSALGSESLFIGGGNETSNGNQNTVFGVSALSLNTSGAENTAVGVQALRNNTSGGANTAFGKSALSGNITGNFNTAIGHNANVSTGTLSNATAIGFDATVNASNKIRLGNDAVTATDIAGQLKVNAQSSTNNFTLPTTRGTANQVLATDGAGATQWVTPASGGGSNTYPNVELSVINTVIQNIPDLATATTNTVLTFSTTNNANASLTGGNTWNGSVFTVGSTGAGWYQINAQVVGVTAAGTISSAGVLYFMDRNNTVGNNKAGALYHSNLFISGNSSDPVTRTASHLNTFIYLNAGDNIRFRAYTPLTTAGQSSNTAADGRTFLNIMRVK